MKNVKRMPRVDELIQREIAEYLERIEFGLDQVLVTVGAVRTAPDLKSARVAISAYNATEEEKERILAIIEEERFEIQTKISKNIRLKFTPILKFELDDRFEKGDRVLEIIRQLEEEEARKK